MPICCAAGNPSTLTRGAQRAHPNLAAAKRLTIHAKAYGGCDTAHTRVALQSTCKEAHTRVALAKHNTPHARNTGRESWGTPNNWAAVLTATVLHAVPTGRVVSQGLARLQTVQQAFTFWPAGHCRAARSRRLQSIASANRISSTGMQCSCDGAACCTHRAGCQPRPFTP
jgi:hypothetical protein